MAGMPMTVYLRELHKRGSHLGLPMQSIFGNDSLSSFCRNPRLGDNDMALYIGQEHPRALPYEMQVLDTKDLPHERYSFFDDPTVDPSPALGVKSSFSDASVSPTDCAFAMESTTHTPPGALVMPLPLHVKVDLARELPAAAEIYWCTTDTPAGPAAAAAPVAGATPGAAPVRPIPPDEPDPRPEDPDDMVGEEFAPLILGTTATDYDVGFTVAYDDTDTIVRLLTIIGELGDTCEEYLSLAQFKASATASECDAVLTNLFPDDDLPLVFDPMDDFSDPDADGDGLGLWRARAAHHLTAAANYFVASRAMHEELSEKYPARLARVEKQEELYVKNVQLWEAKMKVYERGLAVHTAPTATRESTSAKLSDAKLRALLATNTPKDLGALHKTNVATLDKLVDRATTTRAVPGSGDIGSLPILPPLLLPGDCQTAIRDYIVTNAALYTIQVGMLLELGAYGSRLLASYDSKGPDIAKHLLQSSLARATDVTNFAGILAASACHGMLPFSYEVTYEQLHADIAIGSVPVVGGIPMFGPLVKDVEGLALALIDLGVNPTARQENALRLKILGYLGYPGRGSSDMLNLDVTIKHLLETQSALASRHSKDCLSIAALTTVLDDYFKLNATPEELLNAYSHQFSYEDDPLTDLNANAVPDDGDNDDGGGGSGLAPPPSTTSSSEASTADSSLSSLSGSTPGTAANLSKRLSMNMSCTVDDEAMTFQWASDILLNPATSALSPDDFEQLEQAKRDLPETMYCTRLETVFAKRYLGIQL